MAHFIFIEWLLIWLLETKKFHFIYDEGNRDKSEKKHGVTNLEIEDLFHSGMAVPLGMQTTPIVNEDRYAVIGPHRSRGFIIVVFTLREGKVRPISARVAHRKERKRYEEIVREVAKRI